MKMTKYRAWLKNSKEYKEVTVINFEKQYVELKDVAFRFGFHEIELEEIVDETKIDENDSSKIIVDENGNLKLIIENTSHEKARLDVAILNKTNSKLRLENVHTQRLNDYITQQQGLEESLRKENRIAINQSNSWYKKYAKSQVLLELYKELDDAYGEYNSSFDSNGNRFQDNLTRIYEIKNKIKEIENEQIKNSK